LIWGGRNSSLRARATCDALRSLAAACRCSSEAVDELNESYRFLRRLEHRLEMIDDEPDLLIWLSDMSQELEIAPLSRKDFQQVEYREVFGALRRFIASDEVWDLKAFQETLSAGYHEVLSQLTDQILTMPEREQGEIQNAVLKLLIRLRYARLRENLSAMQFLLHDAQENENRDAILEFSAIINANRRDRHHLERVMARRSQVSYGIKQTESGIAIA
jgi:glutamine synthetase adenylyltransferase